MGYEIYDDTWKDLVRLGKKVGYDVPSVLTLTKEPERLWPMAPDDASPLSRPRASARFFSNREAIEGLRGGDLG